MIRKIIGGGVLMMVMLVIVFSADSEVIGANAKNQSKAKGQHKSKSQQSGGVKSGKQNKQAENNTLQQIFTQADANKDGFLSREEFHTAMTMHHGANAKAASQPKVGGQGKENANAPHPFKEADSNGDGQVSFQEFAAFVQAKSAQHQQKGAGVKK